ncbi:glycosyltransferase [Oscillatoria sp. FACHB-1407]|uniref:glycosyltransferase family 2 protein n=1 Tax=Oscillatoria sp. FACHB-1407 TaxID=2692847 RepID=UPI0016861716|nr:glycosyltransferase [Oscillatoria sp. FACHB-1407]MBD2459702.1 glycosyltransferase [Oscillatoria sp. FACHB-1407]
MQEPVVTLVVVPRERFSCARESLESIYEHTDLPFNLVYVDGKSPEEVRLFLENQAKEKGFQLIRTEYYLSPNHARNIGLQYVNTKYLVFVDNDVVVTPGWLSALVNCAEETGATVVGPLTCEGTPIHQKVHFAGGESHIVTDVKGRRLLREKMYKQGQQVMEVKPKLKRVKTELAEFHCVLVRTAIFEQIGLLDEKMLNTKEHLDFCMTVAQAGGEVYFEPDCLVTYVPGPPLETTDVYFYMLRWSDDWTLKSLHHLRDKWNLSENEYFFSKYRKLGWRRRQTIINPLITSFNSKLGYRVVRKILTVADKVFNGYITGIYFARSRRLRGSASLPKNIKPLEN